MTLNKTKSKKKNYRGFADFRENFHDFCLCVANEFILKLFIAIGGL